VLVLDEPTNDLDIESLELLEAALQDYGGTLLLVSHDRAFLDHVVTQTLASHGAGLWKEYAGGYTDYVQQRAALPSAPLTRGEASAPRERGVSRKLTYKETRELASLPAEIESLEAEQKALYARMHAPDYFRQPPDALRADQARSAEIERLLMEKLERWEALEAKAATRA
jgi:ATP-binding cassette subfamily F protein uup